MMIPMKETPSERGIENPLLILTEIDMIGLQETTEIGRIGMTELIAVKGSLTEGIETEPNPINDQGDLEVALDHHFQLGSYFITWNECNRL